jgi:hypothetical protein
MLARLADFYPSTVTIQQATENVDATTGEVTTSWADYAGHVGLACSQGPSGGVEVKQSDQTYVVANWTIALRGYYPTITEKMQAVIDGTAYEILLVQNDSHAQMTRILTRKVT